jgi:hypothetical protein
VRFGLIPSRKSDWNLLVNRLCPRIQGWVPEQCPPMQ